MNERMKYLERIAKLHEGDATDTSKCPKKSNGPCEVDEWTYEMSSVNPRAYGVCMYCSMPIIVFLGRRTPWSGTFVDEEAWEDWVAQNLERRGADAQCIVIRNAAERALRRSGTAQSLSCIGGIAPVRLAREIAFEAIEEAQRMLRRDFSALGEQKREIERQWAEVRAAQTLIDTRYQLTARVKARQKELKKLEERMREMNDRARRGPLPIPKDFIPPAAETAGAVLCDGRDELQQTVVYALVSPSDPELVRYVGQAVNARTRYRSHCSPSAAPKVREWVDSLRAVNELPVMMCLEVCSTENVNEREAHWIAHYRARGQGDLNTSIPIMAVEALRGAA